jgi:hypothetical protein
MVKIASRFPGGDLDHAQGFLDNDDFGPGNLPDIRPPCIRISGQ